MEDQFLVSFYQKETENSDDEEGSDKDDSSRHAPPGWELERSTKVDKYFFFNVESRLKYWQDATLPYGWAVEYSEGGHKTYVNMITGERTLKRPLRKNQPSPDVLARQKRRSSSSTGGSANGGSGLGGGGGNEGSSTNSESGSSSRSGWKLVFSEKFKQRYYFNLQTKKQFWRVEDTPDGWAFEWDGKKKNYFNVFTGEKAEEPPTGVTQPTGPVEKEEGEVEDGEIPEEEATATTSGTRGRSRSPRSRSRSYERSGRKRDGAGGGEGGRRPRRDSRGSPGRYGSSGGGGGGGGSGMQYSRSRYSRSRSPRRGGDRDRDRGRRAYSRSRSRSPPRQRDSHPAGGPPAGRPPAGGPPAVPPVGPPPQQQSIVGGAYYDHRSQHAPTHYNSAPPHPSQPPLPPPQPSHNGHEVVYHRNEAPSYAPPPHGGGPRPEFRSFEPHGMAPAGPPPHLPDRYEMGPPPSSSVPPSQPQHDVGHWGPPPGGDEEEGEIAIDYTRR